MKHRHRHRSAYEKEEKELFHTLPSSSIDLKSFPFDLRGFFVRHTNTVIKPDAPDIFIFEIARLALSMDVAFGSLIIIYSIIMLSIIAK